INSEKPSDNNAFKCVITPDASLTPKLPSTNALKDHFYRQARAGVGRNHAEPSVREHLGADARSLARPGFIVLIRLFFLADRSALARSLTFPYGSHASCWGRWRQPWRRT
ncbi:MAG: hypothetical protein ACP5QO_07665, partial [Clostridia bacterium]